MTKFLTISLLLSSMMLGKGANAKTLMLCNDNDGVDLQVEIRTDGLIKVYKGDRLTESFQANLNDPNQFKDTQDQFSLYVKKADQSISLWGNVAPDSTFKRNLKGEVIANGNFSVECFRARKSVLNTIR